MPRATPSQSRIENAIAAVQACGLAVRAVVVDADGAFTVSVDDATRDKAPSPPQWGKTG